MQSCPNICMNFFLPNAHSYGRLCPGALYKFKITPCVAVSRSIWSFPRGLRHSSPLKASLSQTSSSFHSFSPRINTMASTITPDQYRLPLDVKPTHYEVTVKTDLEKLTFNGFVNIQYASLYSFIQSPR